MATTDPLDSLRRLSTTEPPQWLAANPTFSETTRTVSQRLFASLRPFAPKCPFDKLLIDGFDAEQIWQQIDLQSQPLISGLKRELKKLEQNSHEISSFFEDIDGKSGKGDQESEQVDGLDGNFDASDEDFDGMDEDDDDDDDDEEEEEEEERESEGEEERESGSEEEKSGEEGRKGVVEDGFLKINELEEFLEEDEAREYGLKTSEKKDEKVKDDDEEEGEEEDDEELGMFGEGDDDDDDEEMEELDNARYLS